MRFCRAVTCLADPPRRPTAAICIRWAALAAKPLLILLLPVMALQVALLGPLSEELGWRGCALDALQTKWGALASSLVVGFFWSVWHVPLFFIPDGGDFYYE